MSDDKLTDYQINQLFKSLAELRTAMKDGFDEIKRLLDDRLDSRDKVLNDHEKRLQKLERTGSRQVLVNAILGLIGGSALTAIISTFVRGGLS